jgi:hypothetical protein
LSKSFTAGLIFRKFGTMQIISQTHLAATIRTYL